MNEQLALIIKSAATAFGTWLWTMLAPALPFGTVCTAMVFADLISARRLARRIARRHPDRRAALKFSSARFGRVFACLAKIYTVLLLAAMIQNIIVGESFNLLKAIAGAICFWQAISILENEASCNPNPWARIIGKILIDKTERHLGINLEQLRHIKKK